MRKSVTLLDVAKFAQVSKTTVANAFSRPNLVRAELRERIEAAARELGYDGPDPRGRMLSLGKVNAIGVLPFGRMGVSQFFKTPYQREFLAGVAEACEESGVGLSLVSARDDQDAWGVRTALVDGFIFTDVEQVELLSAHKRQHLRYVVMDFDGADDIRSVRTDNRDGARQATRHLLELGHRRFAIACMLNSLRAPVFHAASGVARRLADPAPSHQEKLAGIAEALAAAGISIDDVPIVETCGTREELAAFGDGVAMLLDGAPQATAVIVLNDALALRILEGAERRKLRVPHDLSITGFDDVPEAARAKPPMTTVHVPAAENGRAAVRLLLEEQPPRQVTTPVRLVIRASTARPRD